MTKYAKHFVQTNLLSIFCGRRVPRRLGEGLPVDGDDIVIADVLGIIRPTIFYSVPNILKD